MGISVRSFCMVDWVIVVVDALKIVTSTTANTTEDVLLAHVVCMTLLLQWRYLAEKNQNQLNPKM